MSEYVGFNVDGKIYRTSRLALTRYPNNFFSTLLDSNVSSDTDDQGNYLIDQDGGIFRYVLNFMRYGELVLPKGFNELGLLTHQAEFFLLPALKDSIEEYASRYYVGLNVGGKIYQTSRVTLTRYPDSFFSSLLDGRIPSEQDDEGNYLIDQDGEIFRHVLNFLRYGELKLPAGFNELGLLRSQADFFSLGALKESTEKHSSRPDVPIGGSIGLMFDDGKLFNTTKDTLLKEQESFFTKMLRGEVTVLRDPHGNYIIDRDGSVFQHILNYLRDGVIFDPLTSAELDRLDRDAKYFGLSVFGNHIQSIKSIEKLDNSAIHLYWCDVHHPCVTYSNCFHLNSIQSVHDDNMFEITEKVQSGVVNMDTINPNGPASIEDIEEYFTSRFGRVYRIPKRASVQLDSNFIRLEILARFH